MVSWPEVKGLPPVSAIANTERWFMQSDTHPIMTSGVWSAANLGIYFPLVFPRACRVSQLAVFNGAAVAGNVDMGLYAPDSEGKPGTKIASKGPTAQAGTNQLQLLALSAAVWCDGLVYLACSMSSGTAEVIRIASLAADGNALLLGGIFTEAGVGTLPATATPSAANIAVNLPVLAALGFV